MDGVNLANPLWLLLLLAIGLFGAVEVTRGTDQQDSLRWEQRDGNDSDPRVSGIVAAMSTNGRFGPVPAGAVVFAIPSSAVSAFEDSQPHLPENWQHTEFRGEKPVVERMRGGYTTVGRAGPFELPLRASAGSFVVC